jgi:hypothetical protein
MATSGILVVDEVEFEQSKVGVWRVDAEGMITVVHLGTFPSKTTELGGISGDAEELARVMLDRIQVSQPRKEALYFEATAK